MSDPALQVISVEEYLRTEQESPVKREYVDGFVYPLHGATRAQAGTSKAHMRITLNFVLALDTKATRAGCRLYAADMKLRIEGKNSFYYPDVMVACGQDNGEEYYETDPCLLVEVLSKRTAAIDRHAKYHAYTSIPSLQMYLIVSQSERRILAYQRAGDGWRLTQYGGTGSISLACLGHTLTLDEVYRGVIDPAGSAATGSGTPPQA
ncbi:Uma2 family endonuclease [Deinococcus planocerae]|uniref:Uma2 family endonuclease n=1 Tax=Deinococcus planocerae TaxID=1737569 RepID=UPI000C7EE5BE|nr:Uma2 family endonuclease [Deinococcus planocerae]